MKPEKPESSAYGAGERSRFFSILCSTFISGLSRLSGSDYGSRSDKLVARSLSDHKLPCTMRKHSDAILGNLYGFDSCIA